MKKLLITSAFILFKLAACSDEGKFKTDDHVVTHSELEKERKLQDELKDKLKKETEAANYEKLNDGKMAKGTKVYAIGKVDSLHDDLSQTFILNTDDSVYSIENHSVTWVSIGEEVKVYGTYEGKSRLELPLLKVKVIEQ